MIKKIICINLIVIFVVLCVIEILCFQTYKRIYTPLFEAQLKNFKNREEIRKLLEIRYHKAKKFVYEERIANCLPKVYKGNKKGGIVTIGCSYTEGAGLEENQSFAYKLNQLTGKTTYNRGISATGTQYVYRQLADKNFKKEIPEVDYVIYTFIYDHFYRLFRDYVTYGNSNLHINYYLNDKNELREGKHPFWFLYTFYTTRLISEYKEQRSYDEFDEKYAVFLKLIEESIKEMKKNYPNAKFILLEVPQGSMCLSDYQAGTEELTKEQIKDIEDLGAIYVNAEKLVGHQLRDTEKYRMPDKDHPSERVWDEIAPALVKKFM
ncbi:MAG: hypothetical protein K6C94_07800 [Candidatus Gastranaerophilales bacterium]|nr:hypothetical protein [Candidatus Gastranaerophilales bacterium]